MKRRKVTACAMAALMAMGLVGTVMPVYAKSNLKNVDDVVEIKMAVWTSGAADIYNKAAEGFNQTHDNIKLSVEMQSGDYNQYLGAKTAAKDLPDLFEVSSYSQVYDFAQNGLLADVSDHEFVDKLYDNAKEAVAKASARINELDGMLSTGNSDSEVSKLNSEKKLKLSEDVGNIMERSLEISESTGGVFNPAIYPIMQLWGFDTKNYKVPNKKELESTLKNINESKIKYDSKTRVAKLDKKMKIDFGGIAKGYTSSEVMKVFKNNGIKSGLVSLGGNVQALGAKPDGSKWKVAVQNPDSDESYIGVLEIVGKAVITSGGYERYFEKDGKTYHHIIDPATGYPADSGLKSVTIISSDGTLADGLSTSLFIMGIDKAKEYWRANSDKFDAILLTNDNKQYVTEGIYSDYSTDYPVEKIKKENHNE